MSTSVFAALVELDVNLNVRVPVVKFNASADESYPTVSISPPQTAFSLGG